MAQPIKIKNIGIGLGALVVACILCVVSINLFFPSEIDPNGLGGGESSSSESSSGTANTDIPINRDFRYAGISDKAALVLIGTDETVESTIDLDDQSWREIRWSPEGDYVSVIGKTDEEANDDLLLYNPTSASWQVLTSFANAEAGIDNYFWETDSTIIFTQGANNKWMHRFDNANKELRKIFPVEGELYDYHNERFITKQDSGGELVFRVYGLEGSYQTEVKASLFAEFEAITSVKVALEGSSVVISGTDAQNNLYTVVYNYETREMVDFALSGNATYLCLNSFSSNYAFLDNAESNLVLKLWDPTTDQVSDIFQRLSANQNTVDAAAAQCVGDELIIKVTEQRTADSQIINWLRAGTTSGEEISAALNYQELNYRGQAQTEE